MTALSDGFLLIPHPYLNGITDPEADAIRLAAGRRVPFVSAINAVLVQSSGYTVLIDSGAGGGMGPGWASCRSPWQRWRGHVPDIQSLRSDVTIGFDADPAQAIVTRNAIQARAASEGFVVTGMPMHFPGFSRIARSGSGDTVQPLPWRGAL